MRRYQLFGSTLESEIEFPDLPAAAADSEVRWRLRRVERPAAVDALEERGHERVYGDVFARLYSHRGGRRIVVDDTGTFDIAPDGTITVAPRDGAWEDFIRGHVVGRVLATALFDGGWLPLHGSAVATREGVIAFLGPKCVGKSTLALALARAGASLVTDDTFPVEPAAPPRAWPGIHSLKVRDDSAASLGVSATSELSREGKHAISEAGWLRRTTAPQPMAAIFLLAPREAGGVEAAVRTPFSPALAAAAVAAHVKPGGMLGPEGVATMLERVAPIVRLVPVHQLAIARDLSRLEAAAGAILEWYGGPA